MYYVGNERGRLPEVHVFTEVHCKMAVETETCCLSLLGFKAFAKLDQIKSVAATPFPEIDSTTQRCRYSRPSSAIMVLVTQR